MQETISWEACEAWLESLANRALLWIEDAEEALHDMTQQHGTLAQVWSLIKTDCTELHV